MARRLGCDPDAWLELLTDTFYQRATGQLGDPLDVLHALAESLGARPDRHAVAAVHAARIRAVGADGPLRPEAVGVLRALRERGLRTALVSDCWYELPLLLPALPVYPLLDARVFSVELGRHKPDPRMYLSACEQLDVEPDECLYVGDGGSRELAGASALGMTPIRLAAPDLAGHLSFEPELDWVGPAVNGLTDVVRLVDRANRVVLV
jgi:putative hydrolase of the HAD superfamily